MHADDDANDGKLEMSCVYFRTTWRKVWTRIKMSLDYLPGTASLLQELDKKLMVLLRDGR